MYIVERLDRTMAQWRYMNCYNHYSEAEEALRWMEKKFKGLYRIREKKD